MPTSTLAKLALVFGFLWLARPTRADAPDARTPIPQDGALQSAITKAENDFHSDLTGARSLGDKAALAQRIFETSEDEQQDKLRRYALLVLARDTAARSADLSTATIVVDMLDAHYQVDTLPMKAAAATTASKLLPSPAESSLFFNQAAGLAEEAISAERYNLAAQFASATQTAADKSSDPKLVVAANELVQNVKEADASHGTAKEAAIVLATAPDDSAANLNVGRFRCFIKGDWTAGLLHLAKGSDLRLKALAAGDLRTPTDTSAESPWPTVGLTRPSSSPVWRRSKSSAEPTAGISQPRRTSPG